MIGPLLPNVEVLALMVAEADKPFLVSLRDACDWDVSALSRAAPMIRFLAGEGVISPGSVQVRSSECCWKAHASWGEQLC